MTRPVLCQIIVLLFFNIPFSGAQTKSELRGIFFESESFVLYEEWQEALPGYLKLYTLSPDNYNYSYRIGLCYINIPGEKEKSLSYLQDAVRNINPKYKEGSYREKGAPYDALYNLASAYQITNQLDKAIETYTEFLDGMDHEVYDSTIVQLQIRSCHTAKELMSSPLYLKKTNQGSIINSEFSEFNPVVSTDESVMVFSRKLQFYTAIFFTHKVNGQWATPEQINTQLLIDDGISTSLSNDGKELYLYKSDNYDGNIYVSNYIDGVWTPAVKLNDNINTNYWESHAVVSPDGNKLYFTSNRKGGYGGLDIYVSERDKTGTWGPAVNIGPEINTPHNEDTPFLDISGKTLFFSSRGHYNMGGHDIFYSTLLENEKWSVPLNMGYPVNSTDDDTFFSPIGEGYIGYGSGFDPEGYGEQDIFRLEIFSDNHPRKFSIRGIASLKDLMNRYRDSIKISALNTMNLDTLVVVYSDPETGGYELELPHGNFRITYESAGSAIRIEDLNLALNRKGDSVKLADIVLPKADYKAILNIISIDSTQGFKRGEKIIITLETEPFSSLTTEHWVDSSLLKTENFQLIDESFEYELLPETGVNMFLFTLRDRFNNITTREFNITVPENVIADHTPDQKKIVTEKIHLKQDEITDSTYADPSIGSMRQALSGAIGDDPGMQEVIRITTSRNIQNAGEWLGTLYALATEDEVYRERMLLLIAAMSAEKDVSPKEYLAKLSEYSEEDLQDFTLELSKSQYRFKTIEKAIQYLIDAIPGEKFTQNQVFEALARMIADANKSADQIMNYLETARLRYGWLMLLFAAGAISMFLIIFYNKRRKQDKD